MWQRVRVLLGARLAAGPQGGLPVAALLSQALIASLFCGLVGDQLPPFAYGLFALTLSAALLLVPLLGELGWLLRADEAREWSSALPVRDVELRIARSLHMLLILWALALGSLVPAAVFAPETTDVLPRLLLPVFGLGLATLCAALLTWVQGLLGGRAETLLVAFQTVLVVGVVVGLVAGIRFVPELARIPSLGDEAASALWLYPPAWFAAPLASAEGEPARWWLAFGVFALALAALVASPEPRTPPRRRVEPWLAFLLRPARALATRLWVRRDERAAFDLVYDAVPLEREIVLRTYPMIGIPLAFLVTAATGPERGSGAGRADILALLLFTAGVYLPILLTQIPGSASHRASWLHQTAPIPEGALVAGTIKALAVRFVLPLYVVLSFIAWTLEGPAFVLRLALPGALASLVVLRKMYPVCVVDRPLSVPPDELHADLDWSGPMLGVALLLTFGAVLANRFVTSVTGGLALAAVLLALELFGHRGLRRQLG